MKRALIPSLAILTMFSFLFLSSCTSRKQRIKEYVEAINFEHQLIINRLDAMERALESYVPDIMDKAYEDALRQLDSSVIVVKQLTPPTNDANLRDDALLLFDTYRLLLENDYFEIKERQKKPAGRFTVADEFLVTNLGKLIYNNRKSAGSKYERVAAEVLEQYGIPFTPVAEDVVDVSSSKTPDSTE